MLTYKTKDSYSKNVMPTFDKQITQPGKKLASTPDGKQRVWINITKERQQGWIEQFKAMKAVGLKVPAPFVHRNDAAGKPLTEEEFKKITSKDNAGWWEDFWIDQNDNLMGRLNVPLEEDAKRICNTIVEVSPTVRPTLLDGNGRQWTEESLHHVALVTHPVDQNQPNFQPINEEGAQMSNGFNLIPEGFQMADDLTAAPAAAPALTPAAPPDIVDGGISAVVQILQDLGLELPADTNQGNLLERIVSTGRQMLADKAKAGEGEPSTTEAPAGAQAQPAPVALSLPDQQYISIATKSVQQGYVNRINALVQKGSVPQKFASENLLPMVNGFQLSIDPKGNQTHSEIDTVLLTLEAVPSLATPITGLLPGATGAQFAMDDKGEFAPVVQENPVDGHDLEGEEFEKAVDQQIKQAGLKPSPLKQSPWSE